jgi:hypothetical protein
MHSFPLLFLWFIETAKNYEIIHADTRYTLTVGCILNMRKTQPV